MVQIFWNEDDAIDNRYDAKIFRALENSVRQICNDEKFATGDRNCSNFRQLDSDTIFTIDNKKVYIVKTSYTMEWRGSGLTGTEFPMIRTSALIYDNDGVGSWSLEFESIKNAYQKHSDEIIHMIKSFSMNPTAAAVVQQAPQQSTQQTQQTSQQTSQQTQVDPTTGQSRGGGCLIATAAFGSEMAPQVQFLRELRDDTVLQTESGSAFMTGFNQFYYSFSPVVADYERENPAFKEVVKLALTPLLASLSLLQYADIDSESEMLGYGISIILLNIGIYFVAPAILIMRIRKR